MLLVRFCTSAGGHFLKAGFGLELSYDYMYTDSKSPYSLALQLIDCNMQQNSTHSLHSREVSAYFRKLDWSTNHAISATCPRSCCQPFEAATSYAYSTNRHHGRYSCVRRISVWLWGLSIFGTGAHLAVTESVTVKLSTSAVSFNLSLAFVQPWSM